MSAVMAVRAMKILSIDDSKAVHAYLGECFKGTPHNITHSMSGEEGLKLMNSPTEKFDLVLLDWEMPGMTGPELLEIARKSGLKVPIIMLTTKNKPEDIMDVLKKGAQEYVMKPFTPDIIFSKISSVLQEPVSN
jgi:two-component system chemotaxis response regulator CheY